MIINFLTKILRRYLVGKEQEFVFKKVNEIKFSPTKRIGLYVHIPFCKSMCPYCAYNKIKYDKSLVKPYLGAVLKEIELYYEKLGKVEISSVYIGGGTPTNLIDELSVILKAIKEKFTVVGDICLETSISDINKSVIKKLKKDGITLISIGVQSFKDKHLCFLGRNYQAKDIFSAIEVAKLANFSSVNLDLMFALPAQSITDVMFDLDKAINLNINQITTYPLFTFPYSSVGKYLKLKKIKMPNILTRRKVYKKIHNYLLKKGFNRVSVWGFKKGDSPRYSSVTRDYYIGVGAGAGSSFSNVFYLNTFSVSQYIKTLSVSKLPISVKMDITPSLSKYYWFYWKLYDTCFSREQIKDVFGNDKKVLKIIKLFQVLRLVKENGKEFFLTERGSFWIHLAQNYFMLNYINKVWSIAMKEPWPEKIKI